MTKLNWSNMHASSVISKMNNRLAKLKTFGHTYKTCLVKMANFLLRNMLQFCGKKNWKNLHQYSVFSNTVHLKLHYYLDDLKHQMFLSTMKESGDKGQCIQDQGERLGCGSMNM